VVVCLDGSALEYRPRSRGRGAVSAIARRAGVLPARQSALRFTNEQRVDRHRRAARGHGIGGNFFLDRETGKTVMMNDASCLQWRRSGRVLPGRGAVTVVTAKDKLRRLLAMA
jgi:phosphonoacetate hydrolase